MTQDMTMDQMIADLASKLFADHGNDDDALWAALDEVGFIDAWVVGGSSETAVSLADGLGLARLAARSATGDAFIDTLLASHAFSSRGDGVPNGPISLDAANVPQPLGALVRSSQICGAMEAALDLTLDYAGIREQFGRPLAKFQAIQHLLSDMAGEIAAASAALDTAVNASAFDVSLDDTLVAVAKIRASEAAGLVAANAHQIHGAIGYTDEYQLARFTRRLWQWRDEFGDETFWALRLGQRIADNPASLRDQLIGS